MPEHEPEMVPSTPTFGRLLASNVRVVAATAVLAVAAYGVWRGLAVLFPETAWLRLNS